MDVKWLEDFLCLARSQSFTRAASERNVTQSAFSRRIRALEHWAGQPLIDRSGYPVGLLPAGIEFLPVAREIVGSLERVRGRLSRHTGSSRRFQTFAATHAVSVYLLPTIRGRLELAVPGVRIRVRSDNFDACCRFLERGSCDVLACYRHPRVAGGPDESRFDRIDVATDMLIPVVAPDDKGRPRWSLAGRGRKSIPHLSYTGESHLGAVVEHLLAGRECPLSPVHLDAFAEALKGQALQSLGVAWLPLSSVRRELDHGLLVCAGGADWSTRLVVSLYADVKRLDATGKAIWSHFSREARAGGRQS